MREEEPELYAIYMRHQIFLTLIVALFSLGFAGAITYIIHDTGDIRLIWLYLLPTMCYMFS